MDSFLKYCFHAECSALFELNRNLVMDERTYGSNFLFQKCIAGCELVRKESKDSFSAPDEILDARF